MTGRKEHVCIHVVASSVVVVVVADTTCFSTQSQREKTCKRGAKRTGAAPSMEDTSSLSSLCSCNFGMAKASKQGMGKSSTDTTLCCDCIVVLLSKDDEDVMTELTGDKWLLGWLSSDMRS